MGKPSDKRRIASKGKRRREPERSQRRWPTLPVWAAALLVGVIAVVAYLGIRAGDFVWDDQILLVEWRSFPRHSRATCLSHPTTSALRWHSPSLPTTPCTGS
jgi:ABC-type Fe3+ transport system permease subunit